ncbi:MAG: 50S ribosomal protein L10 [Deltaproteobacteria bacterium]|nr:MAG: 50S ribosomal protein L10 [Deltaproteobacteria bacterium]
MRLASKDTEAAALEPFIQGTCAIAISYDDPVVSAKLLRDFAKENEHLKIKGGFLQSQVLEPKDVIALADIPSREVLLGQLLGVLNGIPTSFVSVLSAVPRSMVNVLSAIQRKKEEEQ